MTNLQHSSSRSVSHRSTLTGVVVIGRNEAARLRQCLRSVVSIGTIVYVDSGSTDGSPELARQEGASVIELDNSTPFSAARARNEGTKYLVSSNAGLQFIQFVDGDCEIVPTWHRDALNALVTDGSIAAVAGRLREMCPTASHYNRLCNIEWRTRVGEASSCGGLAMYRVSALLGAGGFRTDLSAGEEPELCLRLRRQGWRIVLLPVDMGLHDASLTSYRQWWRRMRRSGYAYAEGAWIHIGSGERYNIRQVFSALFWGAACPTAALIAAILTFVHLKAAFFIATAVGMSLVILWWRAYTTKLHIGNCPPDARLYAMFMPLIKLAEASGVMLFAFGRCWRALCCVIPRLYRSSIHTT